MTRTLIITNDFPPRPGGIQAFVHALARHRPPGSVVVYCSTPARSDRGTWRDPEAFDIAQPFPVIRERTSVLLPGPAVRARARRIARLEECDSVLFGSAVPLGAMAAGLRRDGVRRIVALTHGHEAGWASLPGARGLLRSVGANTDTVTYLGDYTRARLARVLDPAAARRMRRLAPGVDTERFRPGAGGAELRERLDLGERPVVACVSRLVPRKGQDTLIRAWPRVRADIPDAVLLLVGGGPYRSRLEALARERGVADSVRFTGSVAWDDLPAHYDAADVFAMPCRSRNGGLDVEGLGIVFLEAAAAGLPVVAGASGGAPDAVRDGDTGHVVDPLLPGPTARRLIALLGDPAAAAAMGGRGRERVAREWTWAGAAQRLDAILG
ncbi:phosphatidylinositol alpha-1,6-mannosyltransferase [Murinocardiopsis flavida]|uniref:Phosphatidylinositol alpha-1,6-mannosyltransferase n=1 Tax=Murinocardiopsis flavida TaxID=645275 RepID=A0A2P8D051_9ACTN|nr:glycosyltransferase family 4 protein [Murinocardiopsis flavida]PSK90567.1 phosphatidylinositol alpha-1,6-mannosyltransferase [Murinocardiopsis flavida]